MSGEGRPTTPARRPETARRRTDEPETPAAPPTREELVAVERHLVTLTELSGASALDVRELGVTLARLPGRGPAFNYASVIRWPEQEWAHRARTLIQQLRADGEWPTVMIADGLSEPSDLTERLVASGWVEMDRERILWTRHPATVPHLDPSLRVEAVTRRTAPEHEALERAIFGLSAGYAEDREAHLVRGLDEGRLRAFLVRSRGAPVAVARVSVREGIAGLYAVGVADSHRRQGFGRLVTTVATRAGLASGNQLVWLSVDETNLPAVTLYRSLGYRPAFTWRRLLGPERPARRARGG